MWWKRKKAAKTGPVRVAGTRYSHYRDGGILDFGQEHVYLDETTRTVILLPSRLVQFIQEQRSEQQ